MVEEGEVGVGVEVGVEFCGGVGVGEKGGACDEVSGAGVGVREAEDEWVIELGEGVEEVICFGSGVGMEGDRVVGDEDGRRVKIEFKFFFEF